MRINASGGVDWLKNMQGEKTEYAFDLDVDPISERIYLSGYTVESPELNIDGYRIYFRRVRLRGRRLIRRVRLRSAVSSGRLQAESEGMEPVANESFRRRRFRIRLRDRIDRAFFIQFNSSGGLDWVQRRAIVPAILAAGNGHYRLQGGVMQRCDQSGVVTQSFSLVGFNPVSMRQLADGDLLLIGSASQGTKLGFTELAPFGPRELLLRLSSTGAFKWASTPAGSGAIQFYDVDVNPLNGQFVTVGQLTGNFQFGTTTYNTLFPSAFCWQYTE